MFPYKHNMLLTRAARKEMGGKACSGMILTLLIMSLSMLVSDVQPAKATSTTIIVPDHYPTIQEAINSANEGDIIFVKAGIYYENVVLNKSVSLFGEDRDATIIDVNKTGDVIWVRTDNVTISGFTIRNGDVLGWHAGWGIYIRDSSGVNISGNNVTGNKAGIGVEYGELIESANCKIEDNIVNNNFEGISLYRSNNCTITRNNVTDSYNTGVYLFASSYSTIISNQIESTLYYGIALSRSSNNTISNNIITNNGEGIHLYDSSDNVFFQNNFISNQRQVFFKGINENNTWDAGYPSGGNYWSDYTCTGNPSDGSQPYIIDENNIDYYPFKDPSGWLHLTIDTMSPVADAGSDRTVNANEVINFNADESSDNVGIVSYEWDFGDGTLGTGKTTSHAYDEPGTYTVTLTLKDAAGNWATDDVVINVHDITPPVANAGSDQTVAVNEEIGFDAAGSSDNVGIISYEWDFGDGTSGTGVTTTHIFTKPGTYTIILTVEDEAGNVDTDSLSVKVEEKETPKEEKKGCIIATATYGSELSPEVQFLRGFRDNAVMNTFAGSSFMTMFNAWYYSFSPGVATVIAANEALRSFMEVLLYPFIGILHLATTTHSLLSFNQELAVVMTGLVASLLIGAVYLSPFTVVPLIIMRRLRRTWGKTRLLRLLVAFWLTSVILLLLGEISASSIMMMIASVMFVLINLSISAIVTAIAVLRRLSFLQLSS